MLKSKSERVWQALLDHPDCTSSRIASLLNLDKVDVSRALSWLNKQGAVMRVKDKRRSGQRGGTMFLYKANGTTYTDAISGRYLQSKVTAQAPTVAKPAAQTQSVDDKVKAMPLAEAAALYKALHHYFGGQQNVV